MLNGKNPLRVMKVNYLLTVPKLCRTQALDIARLDLNQDIYIYIVNRKLETKSICRKILAFLVFIFRSSFEVIKKQNKNLTMFIYF